MLSMVYSGFLICCRILNCTLEAGDAILCVHAWSRKTIPQYNFIIHTANMAPRDGGQRIKPDFWRSIVKGVNWNDYLDWSIGSCVSSDFQAPSMSELEKASLCIGESSYQTGRVYYHDNAWYWVWTYKGLLEEFCIYI